MALHCGSGLLVGKTVRICFWVLVDGRQGWDLVFGSWLLVPGSWALVSGRKGWVPMSPAAGS
jgi:hypothetical protein